MRTLARPARPRRRVRRADRIAALLRSASQTGRGDGYERESLVVNHCPTPERFTHVPAPFARVPGVYLAAFADGQLAYRTDHLAAHGTCPVPV